MFFLKTIKFVLLICLIYRVSGGNVANITDYVHEVVGKENSYTYLVCTMKTEGPFPSRYFVFEWVFLSSPNGPEVLTEDCNVTSNYTVDYKPKYEIICDELRNGETKFYLRINSLNLIDDGNYQCGVRFIEQTDPFETAPVKLYVFRSPTINPTASNTEVDVRVGHDANMTCTANGIPAPKIKWRRYDHKPLPDRRHFIAATVTKRNETQSVLHLFNVTKEDYATYECLAMNGAKPDVKIYFNLRVQFKPTVSSLEDENSKVYCAVDGFPVPSVSWYKITQTQYKSYTNDILQLDDQFFTSAVAIQDDESNNEDVYYSATKPNLFSPPQSAVNTSESVYLVCRAENIYGYDAVAIQFNATETEASTTTKQPGKIDKSTFQFASKSACASITASMSTLGLSFVIGLLSCAKWRAEWFSN